MDHLPGDFGIYIYKITWKGLPLVNWMTVSVNVVGTRTLNCVKVEVP